MAIQKVAGEASLPRSERRRWQTKQDPLVRDYDEAEPRRRELRKTLNNGARKVKFGYN